MTFGNDRNQDEILLHVFCFILNVGPAQKSQPDLG